MSTIRVYTKRVKGTVDRDGARTSARQVGRKEATSITRKIMNQATIDCPVDTGNLRSHHRMAVRELKTMVKGEVVNDAKYAAAVHDGSPPHTIRARRKQALRFTVGGETIIVRSVRHPGAKGRPWLRDAAEKVATSNGWRFKRTTTS